MKIWRIAGIVLMAGLALFLLSIVLKLMLIALATVVVIRVVGGQIAGRFRDPMQRVDWQSANVISIDNPTYRSPMNATRFDRIIPIS